jgi:predicted membrane channel-forming protein YqfA (hemolysin III family)
MGIRRKNILWGAILFLLGLAGIGLVFNSKSDIWWHPPNLLTLVFSYLLSWFGLFQMREGWRDAKEGPWTGYAGGQVLFLSAVIIIGLILLVFLYVQGAMKNL